MAKKPAVEPKPKPAHFPCSPSTLERRENCPGSLRLESTLPEETSEDAERGTKLHDLVRQTLLGTAKLEDVQALNDFDAAALDFCVKTVNDTKAQAAWEHADMHCEVKVDLMWFHPLIGGGTVDVVLVLPFDRAILFDFKFGMKPVPPAAENLQLAAYAAGVRRAWDLQKVFVAIIQPALGVKTIAELDSGIYTRAQNAAVGTQHPRAELHAGTWCEYCRARGQCPEQITAAATVETPAGMEAIDAMPISKVSEFLKLVDERNVEKVIGWAKARMLAYLTVEGNQDSNYELDHTNKHRVWVDDVESKLVAVAKELERDPESIYSAPEVVTPAQLEKVWGKAAPVREALKDLILKPKGDPVLVKREAAPLATAGVVREPGPGGATYAPGSPRYTGD